MAKLFSVCRNYLQHPCNVLCFTPSVPSSATSLQGNTAMRNLLYAATALAAIAALPVAAHAGTITFGYSFSTGGPTTTSATPFNSQDIGNR